MTDEASLLRHIQAEITRPAFEQYWSDGRTSVFVLESGKKLVGYSVVRMGSSVKCVTAELPAEISRIYLRGEAKGSGWGSKLMNAMLTLCEASGADWVWLGVWGENHRAVSFYRKWGFQEVGTHEFVYDGEVVHDLVMARRISGAPMLL